MNEHSNIGGTVGATTAALLDERQAAAYLGWTPRTMQQRRFQGAGPRFVRLGARSIRYRVEDLDDFIEARLHTSTAEYEG
jgi:predicted DNA-binding transcriptional regulator AlpA